ncbi:MAG: fibronectin type III domain-containing protein [Actinomycetota bacterium]
MRRSSSTFLTLCLALATLAAIPASPAVAVNPAQPTVVSANPANWTPHVLDGIVNTIVPVGNQIVAGGTFTQVKEPGGPILARTNLFAFDATTGAINTNFAPVLDGEVLSLATDGSGTSVFVGGSFTTVNGQTNRRLVKLSIATGQRMTFAGKINSGAGVYDMLVRNNKLYIGGAFSTVNKTTRQRIAAFDLPAGTLDPNLHVAFAGQHNGGSVRVHKFDISPDGTKLVAIGNFLTADGLARRQVAMLDLTTTPVSVANWQTIRFVNQCTSRFDTYLRDIDFDPTGQYFVIGTTGAWMGGPGAGVLCDSVSRWKTSTTGTGVQPEWVDYTGGDTTFSVAATGTAVYVGGHQRWWNNPFSADRQGPGAVSRPGIAALDPLNGVPFQWNPVRDPRGLGVQALVATDAGLWVGSDTANIGGEYHGEIAFMPLEGGSSVPKHVNFDLPNELYSMPSSGGGESLTHRPFTGTTSGTAALLSTPGTNWSNARGAFFTNGRIYAGWNDGTFTSRTFDGTTVGPLHAIGLNGLTSSYWPVSSITGMALDNGRLYYTVNGDTRLLYRYFTPESDIVGAETFVASGNGDGFSWSDVSGIALSSGRLFFARTNGNLYSVAWVNGKPSGAIATIGGPAIDGKNYASRGMFVWGQNADKTAPTVPGTPTGMSTTTTSIDLTWGASTDAVSQVVNYHVYRDGGPDPVATVASASTGTVSYVDVGLPPSSTHTYRVSAVDEAGNESARGGTSASIQVMAPDLNPPTIPGTPSGTATGKTSIDVTWAASTDDGGAPITYRVYRDGGATPVGTITSASTTTVTYGDAGLDVGSTHTYRVDAVDESANPSAKSAASVPVSTGGTFWSDGFDTADFSAWTSVTRMSIAGGTGGNAPPSAFASPVAQSATASKTLGADFPSICLSANVNITNRGTAALDLMRLRTAGNGNIGRVLLNASGILQVKSDVSGTVKGSGASLSAGWHSVEVCMTVGAAGTWDLYLDGTEVVTGWVANTGTTPVGRVQIGDSAAKTFTANFDDVVVDGFPG